MVASVRRLIDNLPLTIAIQLPPVLVNCHCKPTLVRPTQQTIVLDLLCSKYRTKRLNGPGNSDKNLSSASETAVLFYRQNGGTSKKKKRCIRATVCRRRYFLPRHRARCTHSE